MIALSPKQRRMLKRAIHTLPRLALGCVVMAALCGVAVLIWTLIAYYGKYEPAEALALPVVIWLAATFITTALLTWLEHGGTVIPILVFSLLAAIISFLLLPGGSLRFGPALGKALLTMIAGMAGFTVVKLMIPRPKPPQRRLDDELLRMIENL